MKKLPRRGDLKNVNHGVTTQILKAIWDAPNGTLLSEYPWTGAGEIRPPNGAQWFPIVNDPSVEDPPIYPVGAALAGRYIVDSNLVTGNIVGYSEDGVNVTARSLIDAGAPISKLTCSVRHSATVGKRDISFFIRAHPTALNSVGSAIYHNIQLLRYVAGADTDPAIYIMTLWCTQGYRITSALQLMAQVRLKSEIVWQAATPYDKVVVAYAPVGDSVIPATPNGKKFECIVAGTSGATEPAAFATAAYGDVIAEGPNTLQWQCSKNVDYQSAAVPIEIIDTGSIIKVTVDNAIVMTAFDATNYNHTHFGFSGFHDPASGKYGALEAWT